MTYAEKAKAEFDKTNIIPNMGQGYSEQEEGTIHCFPDGSSAMHWNDGGFDVGEMVDE